VEEKMNVKSSPVELVFTKQNSRFYLKSIEALQEIKLPDQWYTTKETIKLPERWRVIAKKFRREEKDSRPVDEIVGEFMEKYQYPNKGKPFKSTICFNRPFICERCAKTWGYWVCTVVSNRDNVFLSITAEESHNVLEHEGMFTPDKLKAMETIFGNVQVKPVEKIDLTTPEKAWASLLFTLQTGDEEGFKSVVTQQGYESFLLNRKDMSSIEYKEELKRLYKIFTLGPLHWQEKTDERARFKMEFAGGMKTHGFVLVPTPQGWKFDNWLRAH